MWKTYKKIIFIETLNGNFGSKIELLIFLKKSSIIQFLMLTEEIRMI